LGKYGGNLLEIEERAGLKEDFTLTGRKINLLLSDFNSGNKILYLRN
jgi:hypothetical protein